MTNIINSFKKYKTSKQKNHQKKYSIKKFNNFKRKGGAINVPIYLSIPEEDKCPDLKTLNTDITNLKTPTNEEDLVKLIEEMKKFGVVLSVMLMVLMVSGCGKKRVNLNPGVPSDIAVLSAQGPLTGLNADQQRELDIVTRWMDKNIIYLFC